MTYIHLAHYMIVGGRAAMSGERFLIEDKFVDRDIPFCQLFDEQSRELNLFILSGILNLDGQIVLLLDTADPEDRESEYQTYSVVRLLSPTTVELVEEDLTKRIQQVAEAALGLTREENLALMIQYLGPLRDFGTEEVLARSKPV